MNNEQTECLPGAKKGMLVACAGAALAILSTIVGMIFQGNQLVQKGAMIGVALGMIVFIFVGFVVPKIIKAADNNE